MEVSKATGLPLVDGIETALDLPHTITYAITYRSRINSLMEIPKNKRPPRNLWDKPTRLSVFMDEMYPASAAGGTTTTKYLEFNDEDVE